MCYFLTATVSHGNWGSGAGPLPHTRDKHVASHFPALREVPAQHPPRPTAFLGRPWAPLSALPPTLRPWRQPANTSLILLPPLSIGRAWPTKSANEGRKSHQKPKPPKCLTGHTEHVIISRFQRVEPYVCCAHVLKFQNIQSLLIQKAILSSEIFP